MTFPEPQFDELYREAILDHYRRPRNRGQLESANRQASGMNPVCGDEVELQLRVVGDRIDAIGFEGSGCSISQCSASMLTERLTGETLSNAEKVTSLFRSMLLDKAEVDTRELGDLEALQGVAQYPVRVKCALLAWNVLKEALEQPS